MLKELIVSYKNKDEDGYIYVAKKMLTVSDYDMFAFSFLIAENDIDHTNDDELYKYFSIWSDGYQRGIADTAHSMDSLIYY